MQEKEVTANNGGLLLLSRYVPAKPVLVTRYTLLAPNGHITALSHNQKMFANAVAGKKCLRLSQCLPERLKTAG